MSGKMTFWTGIVALTLAAAITLLVLVMMGHVRADPRARTFYGTMGQEVGRSVQRRGSEQFYNPLGQQIGRSEQRGGVTTYYNERGQIVGTSRERK